MAHGATLGHLEPEDDPEQSHMLQPILPHLRHWGHPPHWLGVWVAEAQGISRAAEPASLQGLTRSGGRGSRCGAPTLSTVPAVPMMISSIVGLTPSPQQRKSGAEASARQPRTPQAHPTLRSSVHRRGSPQAGHVQVSKWEGWSLHQRLEHSAATSLLSLKFQALCTLFVLVL